MPSCPASCRASSFRRSHAIVIARSGSDEAIQSGTHVIASPCGLAIDKSTPRLSFVFATFSAAAARTSALNAAASILSPSWIVDRAPDVAFEAGVEQVRRVVERGALGEGQLHDGLVGLAGADDAVVGPDRDAAPLPLLDHLGIGLLISARTWASVSPRQSPSSSILRVDQLGGRGFLFCLGGGAFGFFHSHLPVTCLSLACHLKASPSALGARPRSPILPLTPKCLHLVMHLKPDSSTVWKSASSWG